MACQLRILLKQPKVCSQEFGQQKKIVSDEGMNFISDKFKQLCRQLNIDQAITSSYHHQSNGQVEACIKFVKHTIKNALIIMMTLISVCCK